VALAPDFVSGIAELFPLAAANVTAEEEADVEKF
jgi:hypothetical protein